VSALLHDTLRGLVLLAGLIAFGVALRAAYAWRDERERVGLVMALALLLLLGMGLNIAAFGAARPGAGWTGWLRIATDAALPVLVLLLLQAMRRRVSAADRAALASPFDPVTDLARRPFFLRHAATTLALCRQTGVPATLLAVAIDDPAALEAAQGKEARRAALHRLAGVLADALGPADPAGMLAEDVPGALLAGQDIIAARAVAARLAALVREQVANPRMDGRGLGVSIGLAAVGDGAEPAVLEEAASGALRALAGAQAAGGAAIAEAPSPPPRRAAAP
jgi:GGDEF domain-containing protein